MTCMALTRAYLELLELLAMRLANTNCYGYDWYE